MRIHVVSEGETPARIASYFGVDVDTLISMNPHKPWGWIGDVPTFATLNVGELLWVPDGMRGLGQLPSVPSVSQIVASSDMVGASPQALYAGASQLQNDISVASSYSQILSSGGTAVASQIAQAQSSLQNVIANGVSITGIQAAQASSLLHMAFTDLAPLVGKLGSTPRLLIGVGEAAVSGALAGACGGPVGSAVGAVFGASIALISSLSSGGGGGGSAAWNWPALSGAAQNQLVQIQAWIQTNNKYNDPIGYQLYDYVSQNFPYTGAGPGNYTSSICTPLLWGIVSDATSRCNKAGMFSGPSSNDLSRVSDEMGFPVGSPQVTLAVQRASALSGFYSLWGPNSGSGTTGNGLSAFVQGDGAGSPPYSYFFALGTCMSMIAAQASDQSIAAELILQQKTLTDFTVQGAAATEVTGEALTLQPLVDYFLAKSPSSSQISGRTFGAQVASVITPTATTSSTASTAAGAAAAVTGVAIAGVAVNSLILGVGFVQSLKYVWGGIKRFGEKHL